MDDLTSRLNDIFSSPEGMEKIKNLVSMLSNSGGGNGSEEEEEEHQTSGNPGGINMDDFSIDPMMIMKMKKAFDMMKKGDPRVDLLLALKPNLSEQRQHKVDEAIQILRMINMIPLLQEEGFMM